MGYPEAPWRMHADLWLSLFRVPASGDRPAGVYGAAWVSYREPSPLTYHELLVVRMRRDRPGRPVTVTDIWVDSVDSRDGGRALWAIPKELCDFSVERRHTGPLRRAAWEAFDQAGTIATARFTDLSALGPRVPFRGATLQPALEPGADGEVTAPLRGSARTVPARAAWSFEPRGPLGWLAGCRRLGSFRLADVRIAFG